MTMIGVANTPLLSSLVLAFVVAASAAGNPAHADETHKGHGGHASQPLAASPLVVPLDSSALATLPRERVQAQAHGKPLDCEGVPLAALLRKAGALSGDKLPGNQLARYVLVGARDGYRVLYALPELDPGTGNRKVFLVDRCDGKPLGNEDGPLRLIAPDDVRPARWVRQVESITVVAAP